MSKQLSRTQLRNLRPYLCEKICKFKGDCNGECALERDTLDYEEQHPNFLVVSYPCIIPLSVEDAQRKVDDIQPFGHGRT